MQQLVTEELKRWIIEQAQAGCSPDSVLAAMRASGWEASVAEQALEATLSAHLGMSKPMPQVVELPGSLADGGDRQVPIAMAMNRPRLAVFQSLLADEECDALISLAQPRLARSETVSPGTGDSEINASRTSQGMFFQRGEHPLVATIEARLAHMLDWPVEFGEGLQILRYLPGAQYKAHFDYFEPDAPGSAAVMRRGGQRLATVVMYLNTPLRGGATTFPDAGVAVAPLKGNAVFFSYDRPEKSTLTLHAGEPVLEGEKWVATKWLREGVFE